VFSIEIDVFIGDVMGVKNYKDLLVFDNEIIDRAFKELGFRYDADEYNVREVKEIIEDVIWDFEYLRDRFEDIAEEFKYEKERVEKSRRDNFGCVWFVGNDEDFLDRKGFLEYMGIDTDDDITYRDLIGGYDSLKEGSNVYFKIGEGRLFPEGNRYVCGSVDGLEKLGNMFEELVDDIEKDIEKVKILEKNLYLEDVNVGIDD